MPSSSCSTYLVQDLSHTCFENHFLVFSSAFNTIQLQLLKDKLEEMGLGSHLVAWINNYLTSRTQYVGQGDCRSETVTSSTGASQGNVFSPFLFTLYTSHFQYNSELMCIRHSNLEDSRRTRPHLKPVVIKGDCRDCQQVQIPGSTAG